MSSVQLLPTLIALQFIVACSVSNQSSSPGHEKCATQFDTLSNQEVYVFVDEMPEYDGGNQALMKYFTENFSYLGQGYFQASFTVEFVIDAKGNLIAPRISGKSNPTDAEQAVLDVFRSTPKWKSGACHGRHVAVKMFVPLRF